MTFKGHLITLTFINRFGVIKGGKKENNRYIEKILLFLAQWLLDKIKQQVLLSEDHQDLEQSCL